MRESSKCENYLNAITNRSRNLIRVRSTRRSPILEVRFRIPSRVPAHFVCCKSFHAFVIVWGKMKMKMMGGERKRRFNEKLQNMKALCGL
jgi:hypothetical protein